MTVTPERLATLDTLHLDRGVHPSYQSGHCAMEAVAWLAGEPHSDSPACVAWPLRSMMICLNDAWPDAQRQQLVPFLPRVIGTAGDGQDEARSYLALDWLIRTFTPTWLDLTGLTAEAQSLRDLRRIVDVEAAGEVGPVIREAGKPAAAAWAAARDGAGDAAWDVARAAAGHAAWAAAWHAARDAAWHAARDAAWDAAWDAAAAAAAAADGDALRPTIEQLQASALTLLDTMIDPEQVRA